MLRVVLILSLAVCINCAGLFSGWDVNDYGLFKKILEEQANGEYRDDCITNEDSESLLEFLVGSDVLEDNEFHSLLDGPANDCMSPNSSQQILDILASYEPDCKVPWVQC